MLLLFLLYNFPEICDTENKKIGFLMPETLQRNFVPFYKIINLIYMDFNMMKNM